MADPQKNAAFFDRLAPTWDQGSQPDDKIPEQILDLAGVTTGGSA